MITVEITLGGRALEWRPTHGQEVLSWLLGRPWTERGQVLLWQLVEDTTRREAAIEQLVQALVALDGGASGVRGVWVRAEGQRETLDAAIARDLPGSVRPVGPAIVEHLARMNDLRPVVLLVSCDGPMHGWVEQGRRLVDLARQQRPSVPLTIILAAHSDRDTRRSYDHELLHAWPAEPLSSELMRGAERLWPLYLHHRLAWEVAGDLDMLRRMHLDASEGLPGPGEDEALEVLLNQRARAQYALVAPDVRSAWVRQLRETSWTGENPFTIFRQLPGPPLIWTPQASGVPMIIPWIARGLLAEEVAWPSGARSWLRHSLVDQRLGSELLVRCIDVESLVRRQTHDALNTGALGDETQRRLDQFERGTGEGEHAFYPRSHPSRPDEPSAFASLGEWLTALDRGRVPHIELWHRLRILRNALAHGHYVSWEMIAWLRKICQQLPS